MALCTQCWKHFETDGPQERICPRCRAQQKLTLYLEEKENNQAHRAGLAKRPFPSLSSKEGMEKPKNRPEGNQK